MKLMARIFGKSRDPREALRAPWHRVVELVREKRWYADLGVADTLAGRFDMVTAVLALVLLRMEREDALKAPSVYLTELFVEDMDGQLRETGVGDPVVGKHVGKLVSALGGRLGAYREALATADEAALATAVARNVSLREGAAPDGAAAALREFAQSLAAESAKAILGGEF